MTHHDDLDRDLTAWLAEDAARVVPAGLFEGIASETLTRRQQPGWLVTLRGESMGLPAFGNIRARRLALVVAVAALLVLVAVLIAGRQPPTPFRTGLLAFVRNGDVYLADADGSNARIALSEDGVAFGTVSWSPDAAKLAIDGSSGVVLLTVATGQADLVGGSNPVWSPDGRELAVLDPSSTSSVDGVLRIVDVATMSTSKAYPVQAVGGLAWSPNGRWLAASGGDAGNTVVRVDVATGEVIEIDATSGHLDSPRKVRWSPDSTRVAFVRYQGSAGPMCGEFVSCDVDVVVADADGANPVVVNGVPGRADAPIWSPDGAWLAFREISSTAGKLVASGIHVVRPDGTDERKVVSVPVRTFAWRPEGDALLYGLDDGTPVGAIWETSLGGDAHPLDILIDSGSARFGATTGDAFAWQQIPEERGTPTLPSAAPVLPSATLQVVAPAPAAPADISAIWPTIASAERFGCDPVTFDSTSFARNLVAHLCAEDELRSASWSPTGRAYALMKGVDFGLQDLVIVRTDGIVAFELPLSVGSGIVWAPDGARLGVVVDGDVWVVQQDANGAWSVVKATVGDAIDLAWSPDGRWIAVAKGDGNLLVGQPDGFHLHSIGSIPLPVSWAPDGTRLAYVRDGDVWVVNVDGTGAHDLTNLPLGGAVDARWSPDGSWIAVATTSAFLLMAPDGSGRRWLDFGISGSFDLVWSPDSTRLAVDTYESTGRVLIVRVDGSPTVQIDDAAGPGWTPDGQFLFATSLDETGSSARHLTVVNRDGGGRHELLIPPSDQGPMVWVQPD